jgi:hypothetical protein
VDGPLIALFANGSPNTKDGAPLQAPHHHVVRGVRRIEAGLAGHGIAERSIRSARRPGPLFLQRPEACFSKLATIAVSTSSGLEFCGVNAVAVDTMCPRCP